MKTKTRGTLLLLVLMAFASSWAACAGGSTSNPANANGSPVPTTSTVADQSQLTAEQFLEKVAANGRELMPSGVEVQRKFLPNEGFSDGGSAARAAGRILALMVDRRTRQPDPIEDPLFSDLMVAVTLYEDASGSQLQLQRARQQRLAPFDLRTETKADEVKALLEEAGNEVNSAVASELEVGQIADGVYARRIELRVRPPGNDDYVAMYFDTILLAVDRTTILISTQYLVEAPSVQQIREMASSLEESTRNLLASSDITD